MAVSIAPIGNRALELGVHDRLEKADYRRIVPLVEQRVEEHGGVDLLVHLRGFRGWSPDALWEDLEFDMRHFGDIGRLAIVGEEAGAEWIASLSRPFTGAEVRYFGEDEIAAARRWIGGPG